MTIAGTMEIYADADALAARAVAVIADGMRAAQKRDVPFRLALAGGSTPRATYRALAARSDLPWHCTEIFFGDERFVPPNNADSNYRMARETLLDHIHPRGVYAIPTDGTPASAVARYEEILRQEYGASVLDPAQPLFDVVLLGLGVDGHTASLLPGQPVLKDRSHWVAAVPQGRDQPRITLTYTALESSRTVIFLVTGSEKRDALAQARGGALPAGGLNPQGQVLWLVDKGAADEDDPGYGF